MQANIKKLYVSNFLVGLVFWYGIEKLAQAVLDARLQHPESTLADLYDPLTMPPDLTKAHKTLDRAVELLYRTETLADDPARVSHLFELYQVYAAKT